MTEEYANRYTYTILQNEPCITRKPSDLRNQLFYRVFILQKAANALSLL
jgi:hypothetical protein